MGKRFKSTLDEDTMSIMPYLVSDNEEECFYNLEDCVDLLNEQQFIIEELETHNLQHFLEWLVIKGYVTDEPMKDINNVIDCVNEFKEYLKREVIPLHKRY